MFIRKEKVNDILKRLRELESQNEFLKDSIWRLENPPKYKKCDPIYVTYRAYGLDRDLKGKVIEVDDYGHDWIYTILKDECDCNTIKLVESRIVKYFK